jgi:energy-coupling factor transporter ATP-binding protein EcfA2
MRLPFPDRVLQQHIAVLGKTGSGKSSALRVIAEHLLDKKRRLAIVDPKGDWWGLKSSADGKGPGYPLIMFGDFKEPRATDVPINQASGRHVAELIATGNRPCVIGFRGWMPGQLTKFWLDFAPTLFNANEGELYVIISEIHNFAPKGKIMDPDSGKCLHWTNRIMSEGRGLGLTFFIDSQRAQKVHNDTLDNCETLVAMRVAHPAARNSIKEWIDGNGDRDKGKEVLETLAALKRGEAWVWSPENEVGPVRVQFPMFQTFDSFAPPQLQKKVSQAGWSEVDLDQVKQKLAAVIAEQKANDPKELKSEIARLRAELNKKQVAVPSPQAAQDPRAISRAVKQRDEEWLKSVRNYRRTIEHELSVRTQHVAAILNVVAFEPPIAGNLDIPIAPVPQVSRPQVVAPRPIQKQIEVRVSSNGDLSGPEKKILVALAELLSIGKEQPPKNMVAAWAGYSPIGGAFGNPIGSLRTKGLIDYPQTGTVTLTEAGRKVAGEYPPPTEQEIWQRIERTCTGPEQKILRALLDNAGHGEISKIELAEKSGYSPVGGAFGNPIGALRTKGLLDYPRQGFVRAAEWLFIA